MITDRLRHRFAFASALTACLLVVAGCGGYNSNGASYNGSTPYTYLAGTFEAGTDSGALRLSIPSTLTAAPGGLTTTAVGAGPMSLAPNAVLEQAPRGMVNCTGSVSVGGVATPMSGTFTTGVGTLRAQTSDGKYSFSGALQNGAIVGDVTVSGGASGKFVCGSTGSSATISVYCGTYQDNSATKSGHLNLILISGGSDFLLFTDDSNPNEAFAGSAAVQIAGSTVNVTLPGNPGAAASGTISGTAITAGTYDEGNGSTGTWSANLCGSYTVNPSGGNGGIY